MPNDFRTPTEVSECLLTRTGDALMQGDFDAFVQCFIIPYEMETVDGSRKIETLSSFRSTFDAVHAHLIKQRVTIMARHCVSASYRGANEVAATHETRLISHDILVQEPYPAFSIIRRTEGDTWKIAFTSYVIMDSEDLNNALKA